MSTPPEPPKDKTIQLDQTPCTCMCHVTAQGDAGFGLFIRVNHVAPCCDRMVQY